MRARPTTLAPVTQVVIVLGMAFALFQLPREVVHLLTALVALGVICLTDEQQRGRELIHRETLRIADIGIRQAARIMELDPSDLERSLRGERKLDDWRLAMLAAHTHYETDRIHAYLTLAKHGLPDLIQRGLKITSAFEFSAERSA